MVKSKQPKQQKTKNTEKRVLRNRVQIPTNEQPQVYTIERLLKKTVHKKQVYYQVKWQGYPATDSTWEKEQDLGKIDDLIEQFEENEAKKQQKNQNYEVEKITGKKIIKGKIHYQVKWKGYPASQNTWEPHSTLVQTCDDLIKVYSDSLKSNNNNKNSSNKSQKSSSNTNTQQKPKEYVIESIVSQKGNTYEIKWEGYKQTTFEPKSEMEKQVPLLVESFKESLKNDQQSESDSESEDDNTKKSSRSTRSTKNTRNTKTLINKKISKNKNQKQSKQSTSKSSKSAKSTPSKNQSKQETYEIEKIMKHKGNNYLIKWKGYSDKDNTWEPKKSIKQQVPKLVQQYELKNKK